MTQEMQQSNKKGINKVYCNYKAVVAKLKEAGVTDLELFKLHSSLVQPGGFVDLNATKAFANAIKNVLPKDEVDNSEAS